MILPAHPLGHQPPSAPPNPPAQGQQSFVICSAPRSSEAVAATQLLVFRIGLLPGQPPAGHPCTPLGFPPKEQWGQAMGENQWSDTGQPVAWGPLV